VHSREAGPGHRILQESMLAGPRSEEVGFAHDSALEGDGFEPSVPRERNSLVGSIPGTLRGIEGNHYEALDRRSLVRGAL
jgi:hypothetical protein